MSAATAVAKLAKIYALPGAKVEPSFLGQPRQNVLHPYLLKYFVQILPLLVRLWTVWSDGDDGHGLLVADRLIRVLTTEKRLVANSLMP